MAEWLPTTKAARFILYTEQGYIDSWAQDLRSDFKNVFFAAVVMFFYIASTLGTFHPVLCRMVLAFCGAVSIVLSTIAGAGILLYA